MSKLTRSNNTRPNDASESPLVRLADFASLTLPSFTFNDDSEVNNSSYQTEKLTLSAPISTSQATVTHRRVSNMAAAESKTTPHCRKCPFPSCMHIFHHIKSSYSLRQHMDGFHPVGIDHNGTSLCPVRTCEYAVLGFTTLDMCMQHLSIYHDPSRPFADYSTEQGIAVAEKPASEEARCLCKECFAKKQRPLPAEPTAQGDIHDNGINIESPDHVTDSDESSLESEPYEAASLAHIMTSIAIDLLSVLGHDMALLAHLLPRIHALLQARICYENTSYAGSDYNTGVDSVGECASLSSSKTRKSSTSSSLGKRGRDEREQEDDGDNGDDGLPKKPRGRPEPIEIRGPRFACPFHKRSPHIYSTVTGIKYRSCSGPGQTEVRRLKEHFQNIHRSSQDGTSYPISDEPSVHNRETTGYQQQSDFSEDKIDDLQWAQISEILRVRRQNNKSDIEKWYELWKVLFPNDDAPRHPYHDQAPTIMPQPSHDIETAVALAQRLISIEAEGDNYILETGSVDRAWNAIRRALEVGKVIARHAPGLSLNTGSFVNPPFEGLTLAEVYPRQLEASSSLPSFIDPAVLGLVTSPNQQQSWQPQSPLNNEHNASFSPALLMGPQAFFTAREANTGGQTELPQSIQHEHGGFQIPFLDISYGPQPDLQRAMRNTSIPATSTSLSVNLSAPQAMPWSQNQSSYHESSLASPRTLNAQHTQIQYTAPSDNFEAGELPQRNIQPDSVCDLLELELGAASNEHYQ